MAKWQNGRMAEWQNGKMAEWQNGRMAEWQNEWLNGRSANHDKQKNVSDLSFCN